MSRAVAAFLREGTQTVPLVMEARMSLAWSQVFASRYLLLFREFLVIPAHSPSIIGCLFLPITQVNVALRKEA